MAFEDSSPERRNLTVIALAFIAYFYGGGQISKDEITLMVVSVEFTRGWVLALMAWSVFIWAVWRYWIASHKHRDAAFSGELNSDSFALPFKSAAKELITLSDSKNNITFKYELTNIEVERFHVKASIRFSSQFGGNAAPRTAVTEDSHIWQLGEMVDIDNEKNLIIRFNRGRWRLLSLKALTVWLTQYPAVTSYYAPYCLTAIAIVGAITRIIADF